MTEQEYEELAMKERYGEIMTPAERFRLSRERLRRGEEPTPLEDAPSQLESKEEAGEHLSALERFRLDKERARRQAKPNELEQVNAAYRRPLAERK